MTEQIPEHHENHTANLETIQWLSFAGNDERKLLILLALHSAGEPLGRTGLHNRLGELSGQEAPGNSAATWSMVEKSLTKTGGVEPAEALVERVPGRPEWVPGYKISDQGSELGLPFAGALLQWSLDHPDISLSQLLGSTTGGGAKAPLTRFWLLYDLATAPDEPKGPAITELAKHVELSKTVRLRAINRLAQFGVVEKSTHTEENPREFRILQPERTEGGRRWAFEKLKPETQMLFRTMEAARKQKEVWSVDDFLELMEELYPDTDHDLVLRARERLTHTLTSEDLAFKGMIQDLGETPFDKGSKVTLNQATQKAVVDLVEILDAFVNGDQQAIKRGRAQAADILSSKEKFAYLLDKARKISNHANRDDEIDDRIVAIVKSMGSNATANHVLTQYNEQTGRQLSSLRIHEKLAELVEKGQLLVDIQPRSKRRQRPTGHYTVVEKVPSEN